MAGIMQASANEPLVEPRSAPARSPVRPDLIVVDMVNPRLARFEMGVCLAIIIIVLQVVMVLGGAWYLRIASIRSNRSLVDYLDAIHLGAGDENVGLCGTRLSGEAMMKSFPIADQSSLGYSTGDAPFCHAVRHEHSVYEVNDTDILSRWGPAFDRAYDKRRCRFPDLPHYKNDIPKARYENRLEKSEMCARLQTSQVCTFSWNQLASHVQTYRQMSKYAGEAGWETLPESGLVIKGFDRLSAKRWRVRVNTSDSGWALDVSEIKFVTVSGKVLGLEGCKAIDSGSASDDPKLPGYEASNAFSSLDAGWWGGRKNADGFFYLGLTCEQQEEVHRVQVDLKGHHSASALGVEAQVGHKWIPVSIDHYVSERHDVMTSISEVSHNEYLSLTGACSNTLNGVWRKKGMTGVGSPYYRKVGLTDDLFLFFDPHCDGLASTPSKWIIGQDIAPDISDADLDTDGGCNFAGSVNSVDKTPPVGTRLWKLSSKWASCEDSTVDINLTLSFLCAAEHVDKELEGTEIKVIELPDSDSGASTDPLLDAACCKHCNEVPACEFWERQQLRCTLKRDPKQYKARSGRRGGIKWSKLWVADWSDDGRKWLQRLEENATKVGWSWPCRLQKRSCSEYECFGSQKEDCTPSFECTAKPTISLTKVSRDSVLESIRESANSLSYYEMLATMFVLIIYFLSKRGLFCTDTSSLSEIAKIATEGQSSADVEAMHRGD